MSDSPQSLPAADDWEARFRMVMDRVNRAIEGISNDERRLSGYGEPDITITPDMAEGRMVQAAIDKSLLSVIVGVQQLIDERWSYQQAMNREAGRDEERPIKDNTWEKEFMSVLHQLQSQEKELRGRKIEYSIASTSWFAWGNKRRSERLGLAADEAKACQEKIGRITRGMLRFAQTHQGKNTP